ncbi:MAG: hypothetical protein MZU79_00870 [Anaerotruncus sp.]|nr:hypothetical protein [Anaerotruncus sp.]
MASQAAHGWQPEALGGFAWPADDAERQTGLDPAAAARKDSGGRLRPNVRPDAKPEPDQQGLDAGLGKLGPEPRSNRHCRPLPPPAGRHRRSSALALATPASEPRVSMRTGATVVTAPTDGKASEARYSS